MKWNSNFRDSVLAFVEDNPRCTSEQIAHATGMPACRVTVEMAALKRRGHVVSEKMTGIRQHYYSMPDAGSGLDGKPLRIIVQQWSDRPKRDEWTALFYGAATA